jgi:hypothetical protein
MWCRGGICGVVGGTLGREGGYWQRATVGGPSAKTEDVGRVLFDDTAGLLVWCASEH